MNVPVELTVKGCMEKYCRRRCLDSGVDGLIVKRKTSQLCLQALSNSAVVK